MSLPNYLAKIKSSGIYRFVWDKSEIAGVDAEMIRLVVGYSEKGPFNTPVYIKTAGEFKSVFGDINKKLERRGVFFHRMALQALLAGPILALNLKKFKDEKVKAASFAANGEEIILVDKEVKSLYDRSRFWSLDPDQLQKSFGDDVKYISIAAADSKEASCSVILRAAAVKGYDVTLKNWFASQGEDLPDYCSEYDNLLVSDFFVEAYVFRGKFTPSVASSDALNKYFDVADGKVALKEYVLNAFGEKIDTLAALAADENSGFLNVYQGVTLPNFRNGKGEYISLDLLFNADYATHHMMMDFNTEALDDNEGYITNLLGSEFKLDSQKVMCVAGEPTKDVYTYEAQTATIADGVVLYEDKKLQKQVAAESIVPGHNYYKKEIKEEVEVAVLAKQGVDYFISDDAAWSHASTATCFEPDYLVYGLGSDSIGNLPAVKWEEIISSFKLGDRFINPTANAALAADRVITLTEIKPKDVDEEGEAAAYELKLVDRLGNDVTLTGQLIKINHIAGESNKGIEPLYFEGYTMDSASIKPESMDEYGKLKWQQNILNVLVEEKGIRLALTNRVDIDYRYIVDTFEGFVEDGLHKQLSLLAKEKDNILGFLNFPAAKTFQNHKKQFLDDKGNFCVDYIAQGGNKQHGIDIMFRLADELDGASWVSYNTPVVFTDGTVKTTVPAAALVSNAFMEKYLSRQPYYIVAGPQYGKLAATGLVGPDFNYSRADLDILEPMGVNATVYVPRKGTFINSNQTAKQNPVTALSKINVRELCIYLQDEIEKLLQNYQWEFNTQALRDKIREKADYICENIKNNGGIYNYLNVCDESNNTDDVINNEMIRLSTSIEPGMGCGKMVQELIMYKKGGMTSVIR